MTTLRQLTDDVKRYLDGEDVPEARVAELIIELYQMRDYTPKVSLLGHEHIRILVESAERVLARKDES